MLLNETAPIMGFAPWVVFLPLIGLTINLLFGKRLGERGAGVVASLAAAGSFAVAVALALGLSGHPEAQVVRLADWITIGDLNLSWAFRVDTLSVTMMLVVAGVGTLIHIYAIAYMHEDVRHNEDPGRFQRFFVYLNLFIAAMMILVTGDNYVMLFVGWEGVGLCSYLLIGFWFEKGKDGIGNAQAAKKAFIANRVGDFGLLIAMFLIFWAFGTLSFDEVFAKAPEVAAAMPGVVLAITLFMLLGVTGKSAQIPLYVWLPDAMAGPTPVSALIHAATMVTAGVYLVTRSAALYALAPVASDVVMWVGAATALFAATIAVGQNDIKKVLAYSTISQLGFMVAAVGMGAYVAGMFHLVTHAFFKALLFLGAGSVILGIEGAAHGDHHLDPQDMRNMGGLRKQMPVTFWVYLIGALALAGIAPLAGFWSKDEILKAASDHNVGVFVVLVLAAFLTAFYMGRQLTLVFFGKPRSKAAEHAKENNAVITVPLMVLAALAVLGGGLNLPGSHLLEHWLHHTLGGPEEAPVFSLAVAGGSLLVALAGLAAGWFVYRGRSQKPAAEKDPVEVRAPGLFNALASKWWIDELYQTVILRPYQAVSDFMAGPVDQGGIDAVANGLGSLTRAAGELLRLLQNGYVRSYALMVLLGAAALLTYLALVP